MTDLELCSPNFAGTLPVQVGAVCFIGVFDAR